MRESFISLSLYTRPPFVLSFVRLAHPSDNEPSIRDFAFSGVSPPAILRSFVRSFVLLFVVALFTLAWNIEIHGKSGLFSRTKEIRSLFSCDSAWAVSRIFLKSAKHFYMPTSPPVVSIGSSRGGTALTRPPPGTAPRFRRSLSLSLSLVFSYYFSRIFRLCSPLFRLPSPLPSRARPPLCSVPLSLPRNNDDDNATEQGIEPSLSYM